MTVTRKQSLWSRVLSGLEVSVVVGAALLIGLTARAESLAAFGRRCIPAPPQRGCRVGDPGVGCVAPPSNTPGIATPPRKPRAAGAPVLGRRALPAGRIVALDATPGLQHGLLRAGAQAPTPAPDPSDIADGMRLYQQKGDCQACHGWAGDGRKMDSQMPDGSNLRETRLDRARLIMTIKCGRPGTGMPAFDKFAYTDGRCYGMKQADLKSPMPDPPATLQQREIERVADFLFQKVVGKGPMDRAKCIEYWGSEVEACADFPK